MSRKREYSREFKEEATRLGCQEGANKAQIARELGVAYPTYCS